MDISLNGYGEQVATFAVSGEVKVGMPVKISANGTVAPCVAKDKFCGVVLSLRGGYAAVQRAMQSSPIPAQSRRWDTRRSTRMEPARYR